MSSIPFRLVLLAAPLLLVACESATLTVTDGTGPAPRLPEPVTSLLPTVDVAPARGWRNGETPTPGALLQVQAFAGELDHPRWLYVLPDGDVLVAETNAPERPLAQAGLRGLAMKLMMKRAGAATPSADRITRLRDADGDGIAEQRSVFLDELHSPFGMALVGEHFYVANTDALVEYRYVPGQAPDPASRRVVAELPAGPRNHHWTKNLIASPDGQRLYVAVGSNSNVAEHGLHEEQERAAILEIDRVSGTRRVYAGGLRNPVGMAFEPITGALWVAVNERDEIGSDLVPDYMTRVRENDFYGWPWSYFGAHVDARVKPAQPDQVARARVPDYALGPHTASLGLAHSAHTTLPAPYAPGMFVGQHGSWNRRPPSGYKVVAVPFADGMPSDPPLDVLGGFLDENGKARGRPVGVAIARDGALLVADDVGNVIWRVTPKVAAQADAGEIRSARAP